MGRSRCGSLPELLRLDRPDDHIGLPQAGIGCLQSAHAIALLQTDARFQPGIDHGDLLRSNPVYAPAFKYTDDPKRFLREIAKRYATDPAYGSKLARTIEKTLALQRVVT